MHIRLDDLTGPEVRALLEAHLADMHAISPPGSVHALDVDALRAPDVTFWSAWSDDELAGCAALRAIDEQTGEIKSMRTAPAWRRRGVAAALLEHLMGEARARGYTGLVLETGATEHFAPARALYTRYGFEKCDPFGEYLDHPHSFFMRRPLRP
jgi:putative acetyltransferase